MSTALVPRTEYRHSTWHQFSPPVCISSSSSPISPIYNMTPDKMRSHMHSSTNLQNSCYLAKYLNTAAQCLMAILLQSVRVPTKQCKTNFKKKRRLSWRERRVHRSRANHSKFFDWKKQMTEPKCDDL